MTSQAYIAGPYTHDDPRQVILHIRSATLGALKATARGYLPIVPHTMGPHRDQTWEGAMVRCRALIAGLDPARDILVRLPGWECSRGAREEVQLAGDRGVRVVDLLDL